MWTKYFYYFQGLRALNCHRTKRSNSTPPPAWISRVLDPPPPARISRIPSVGGVWIFSGTTQCVTLINNPFDTQTGLNWPDFNSILLCLTPDDFTHQWGTPGSQRVKHSLKAHFHSTGIAYRGTIFTYESRQRWNLSGIMGLIAMISKLCKFP